ncbi:hydrogenobyrinic acid a,c-diamide synthase (glutamine-hydrolysing) /cobyrinate a,c-diamide synthase [Herbihabitans rhizosphaerae]|uniref:Hydrogenobyrinate a,c-diamide synthase n=1 Tax=Herbihabitans rhizosphaerae TaxID=1872711 RepID=A0A4Q7L3R9_9PSEU|nr:cobyrinate a,c-diamide synthase [Herbihabitans rhizosphaerae]RZS43400.1 hydrogenobyrinic acid a,c-diamide synthase (glutamine-hydrolysing) /cobyrinate a,c-diamide synthase [Herbihabitans rhizosphaerae]
MVARVVIAAPGSGSGKTTVATGLMAALRRRGERVAPFKVGPDYIDPGYHGLACGITGRNLDPVLVGVERIPPLFRHGAAGASVAVVEGVMGLFDGRIGTDGFGSTAHVAGLLDAPVLLVVDARGQSSSIAALLHGFRTYRPEVRLAGVILNQVGSDRHEEVLRDACVEVGLDVFGVLRRESSLAVPSRHLGLVTAEEHGGSARAAVARMAEVVASSVDLDAVMSVARTAPALSGEAWSPRDEVESVVGQRVVAVAGGPAFTFGYAEHVELLAAAGAEVVVFDPLRDEALPDGTAGLVLPGGFPEQHAAELSANTAIRSAVAAAVSRGVPVHAECGGLLYLASTVDGVPMCGVLDVAAEMTPRLTLGYRDAVALNDSVLAETGARATGHEFHRTVVHGRGHLPAAWAWRGESAEGFVSGQVHASYLHVHPAGAPSMVSRFLRAC